MRILLISDDFLPRIGGVSHMVDRLAVAFRRAGVESAVAAPRLPGLPLPEPAYPVFWDDRLEHSNRFSRARRARHFLSEAIREFQPDQLLLGTHFHYGPVCLDLGSELGLPVALYTHGMDLRRALRDDPHPLKSLLGRTIRVPTFKDQAQRNVARADHLFVNSRYTASLVKSAGATDEVIVTGCGVDLDRLHEEVKHTPRPDGTLRSERRHKLGLPDRKTVGFVGRLVPSKNVVSLVEATATLPDVQLVVAGDGPERQHVLRRAAELGTTDRVVLLGNIENERKWSYLRCFDVVSLPSREMPDGAVEGFGIALLEAIAAGAPVVAGRSGGMADAVVDGAAGLLADPHDPRDIARCVSTLLEDTALAERTVETGREHIADHFNWTSIAGRILRHLEKGPKRKT